MRVAYLVLLASVAFSPVASIQIRTHEGEGSVHPVIDLVLNQQRYSKDKNLHKRPRSQEIEAAVQNDSHPIIWLANESVLMPANQSEVTAEDQSETQPKRDATAQIYVVNLAKRKDRWECAASQLADGNTPYPFDRFEAVNEKDVYQQCPYLSHHHLGGGKPAQGILCSNYKIWEKEVNGTSDFVIIFEDDIAMGMDMWERITDLLNGNCGNSFDYVVVDTFSGTGANRHAINVKSGGGGEFCGNASHGLGLHHMKGAGAQMQIFRRSVLRQLMNLAEGKPGVPIDVLNRVGFNEDHQIRGGMFQARVAAQYKSRKAQKVSPSRADLSESCQKSVGKVDIHGR